MGCFWASFLPPTTPLTTGLASVGICPTYTMPVEPFRLIQSPSFSVWPPAEIVLAL